MLAPLKADHWNFNTAAHLLNRAGFGGTPRQIEELVALGPEKTVARFVDYEKTPDDTAVPEWAKPDPDRAERLRAARDASPEERQRLLREAQRTQREHLTDLRGWWLRRMAEGPRPLQEKMTLFWHGHFATSIEKVRDAYLMWRQNETFRQLATGNWLEMLTEVGQDPAMLIYLDQAQSRRGQPNENFAREVMELFALGEGHYTELDITEAARALTGWSLGNSRQDYQWRPFAHDPGEKTIFGKTGRYDGEDVLKLIVAKTQAARFITSKLWNYFAGVMPSDAMTDALADLFRKEGNNFKPVLSTIFLSEEFYAPKLIRAQVKSPVQWLVGTCRQLDLPLPPPMVSWGITRSLGQDLFAPPNVKGWDGGLTWITTNNLLARYNIAAALVQGDVSALRGLVQLPNPNASMVVENRLRNLRLATVDVKELFTAEELKSKMALIAALEKRLLQTKLKGKQEQALRDYLDSQGELDDDDVRGAIRLVMSTPEYQLT